MKTSGVVTKRLNVALFLYLCLASTTDYLFRPETQTKVPWEAVYEWSPPIAITASLLIVATLIFWGAALLRIFWNSFISDLFNLRNITYNESLAVALIVAIIAI